MDENEQRGGAAVLRKVQIELQGLAVDQCVGNRGFVRRSGGFGAWRLLRAARPGNCHNQQRSEECWQEHSQAIVSSHGRSPLFALF
jgi:hypothetical protein